MKTTTTKHHGILQILLLLVLCPEMINLVGAQSPPGMVNSPYASFSPSLAIIIAVLITTLFLMVFFSIYIRNCSDSGATGNSIARRALSMRRRAAAARGLDASVLETFPILSYSEVKEHMTAKGALECAVCLNEFEDDETLRLIPKCDHVFHPECIDAWLESHVTCPVCRANLVPQTGEEPVGEPEPTDNPNTDSNVMERTGSRNEEVVVQVDGVDQEQEPRLNRNSSLEAPNQPVKSWSMRMLGLNNYRSHSTGHSLVQPGENLDRFTLRLPVELRKEVIDRAILNRSKSYAPTLPREGSTRRGYRGEGSSRGGRFNRKVDQKSGREAKSDRWVSLMRVFSMKGPKVVAETSQESTSNGGGGSKVPVRLPSLKCLEPKASDEIGLFSGESSTRPPV